MAQDMRHTNVVTTKTKMTGETVITISVLNIIEKLFVRVDEKCRKQKQPLFVVFIDLMKVFNLVSRDGLFKILSKTGCPPKLLSIIQSFHPEMKGTVVFDGSISDKFEFKFELKCLRDFLFTNSAAAAVTTYSAKDLQQIMNHFNKICRKCLLIRLKQTQVTVRI